MDAFIKTFASGKSLVNDFGQQLCLKLTMTHFQRNKDFENTKRSALIENMSKFNLF